MIGLGEGVYSVAETCRILQPGMTPRKVHYWLRTGLLGEPIGRGGRGYPTLMDFQQLLKVRTVQHLRDELGLSLPQVRDAFAWILQHLFGEGWSALRFTKGAKGEVVVRFRDERISIPGSQGVLAGVFPELESYLRTTREAWERKVLSIPGKPSLVTDARILSGSPVIRGTRLETAVVAAFVEGERAERSVLEELCATYSRVQVSAIEDALEFEGVSIAA